MIKTALALAEGWLFPSAEQLRALLEIAWVDGARTGAVVGFAVGAVVGIAVSVLLRRRQQ